MQPVYKYKVTENSWDQEYTASEGKQTVET